MRSEIKDILKQVTHETFCLNLDLMELSNYPDDNKKYHTYEYLELQKECFLNSATEEIMKLLKRV